MCELSKETNELRLIGRHGGSENVVQTVPWNGSFAKDVTLLARTRPNPAGTPTFNCSVSGGGGLDMVASGSFPQLTAGRAGVFNRNQADTSYWHFVAKKL